jgi:DNA polymerase III subunit gamma/tau
MTYQVLSQKYRPATFDEVAGQEAATRTLTNSIERGRIANAYIFCGPRGIGKTSVARLLSKTLNCESPKGKSPCGVCDSCREITQGISIDVLEIDGASNRGIDEIRALRENVKFSPTRGKYKIYIIDEVHMLTSEAFNALLKTLEEPPAHVKFIFATTEPQKVLPTIMSRCQRFDFKKITPGIIYQRIKDIASKEKIDVDDTAALMIARAADGSMRDGLVILDQMVSFSKDRITPHDVMELLGMVHKDKVFDLAESIIDRVPQKAAKIIDELISGGKDPVFIDNSLISHFRDIMILKTAGEPTQDMAFSEEELKALNAQKEKLELEEILYILQSLSHCLLLMKGAMFARAPFEIAVIRLTKREDTLTLSEILSKLNGLAGGLNEKPVSSPIVNAREEKTCATRAERQGLRSADPDENDDNGDNCQGETSFEDQKHRWKTLLNYVKNKKMSVFTFLSAGSPVEIDDNAIVIGFDKAHSFNKDALETGSNKVVVQEAADKVMGRAVRLIFKTLEASSPDSAGKLEKLAKKEKAAEEMKPVIEKAMDVFGGHVVRDLMEDS